MGATVEDGWLTALPGPVSCVSGVEVMAEESLVPLTEDSRGVMGRLSGEARGETLVLKG